MITAPDELAPALAAALLAVPVATLLRRPVFALSVRSGEADRTTCPSCGGAPFAVVPDPRGRCASCAARLGPAPFAPELTTAVAAGAFVWRLGAGPVGVVLAVIAAIGVAMGVVDRASLRLPDRLLLLALAVLAAGLGAAAADGHVQAALRAVLAAAVMTAGYLALALVAPGQIGLGDVKLALLLGGVLGWFGWPVVLLGACVPFLLSAGYALVLLALRRITLRDSIPFGPFMLLGAALVVLV